MHYIIVLAVECRICGIHVYSRDCELLCVSPASRQTNTAIVRTKSERQYCGECERKENSEVWGDGLTCSSRSCVLMPLVVDIFCMHAGLMHDARYMRVCVCVRENVEAAITNEIARVRAAYTWADNMPPNILMFSYVSRCIWFGTFGSAHFAHVCSVCCSVKSLDIVVHPSLHSNIHRYDFVFIFFWNFELCAVTVGAPQGGNISCVRMRWTNLRYYLRHRSVGIGNGSWRCTAIDLADSFIQMDFKCDERGK